VAPILMGFDPNLAILFSGIGTLIFFAVVGGAVPSYLGSSFAFIGPVAAVTGTAAASGAANGIGLALGGIVAAGVVYTLIGLVVHLTGGGWIDSLMPPLVTGAVVAVIGLNLAQPHATSPRSILSLPRSRFWRSLSLGCSPPASSVGCQSSSGA
jgi:putative pyrimidine permease RutG